MHKPKSSYLLASIFITIVFAVVYITLQSSQKSQRDSVIEQAKLTRDSHMKERLSRPYGKIEIPAEVYVDLIEPENPRKPVEIVISTATLSPVRFARIVLIKPQTGSEPEYKVTLWESLINEVVDKTMVYDAGKLSVGKHQFNVMMEFLTDSENSKILLAADSLFLDIRQTEILSSNVSFGQIERLELRKELERRVLVAMKPQLKNASSKILAQESMALEEIEPGIIDRKIQELIDSDPDIAQMVEEINEAIEEPVASQFMTLSSQLQPDVNETPALGGNYKPISDIEVPVPDEFRK